MHELFDTIKLIYNADVPDIVDIGKWQPYSKWTDVNQLNLQREFLYDIKLSNGITSVKFILSKNIDCMEKWLSSKHNDISIVDTVTSIEDEVFYTNKIEGAKTTRIRTTEIHNGLPLDKNNYKSEKMVLNGFNATKLLSLYPNRISKDIVIKVWNVIVDNVCENESIRGDKFRIGDVTVGVFNPVSCSSLEDLMQSYCDFYNSSYLDNHVFIKSILIHYLFETIHPFCDGNGRLGRLLMSNFLISRGIESARAVSFSMFIDKYRKQYDVAFIDAENDVGDCTPFIEFMLQVMCEAYESAINLN